MKDGDLIWEPEIFGSPRNPPLSTSGQPDRVPNEATPHAATPHVVYPEVKQPDLTIPDTPVFKCTLLHVGAYGDETWSNSQGIPIGRSVIKSCLTQEEVTATNPPIGTRVWNISQKAKVCHKVDEVDAERAWAPSHARASSECLKQSGVDNRQSHLRARQSKNLRGPHPNMRLLAMVEWDWSLSTTNGFMELVQGHHARRFHNMDEDEFLLNRPPPIKGPISRFMAFLTDLGMIVQSRW